MNEPSNLHLDDDAIQDELVAYLDGELDDSSVRRVEQRLAEDPQYRERMQELEKTWRLLDNLPQVRVEESFTKSTVEMIAVIAEREVEKKNTSRSVRRVPVAVASFLGIALASYFLGMYLFPDPNDQLMKDLPIVENLDEYRYLDDIEFLRKLDESGLFAEETDDELQ